MQEENNVGCILEQICKYAVHDEISGG